jgi:hypothetical protein
VKEGIWIGYAAGMPTRRLLTALFEPIFWALTRRLSRSLQIELSWIGLRAKNTDLLQSGLFVAGRDSVLMIVKRVSFREFPSRYPCLALLPSIRFR